MGRVPQAPPSLPGPQPYDFSGLQTRWTSLPGYAEGQAQHLRQGGLRLRPEGGRLRLPSRRAFAAPGQDEGQSRSRGEVHRLSGQGLILQGVRAESEMHLQQAGVHPHPRGPFEGCLDRVRAYRGTFAYEKALRKRSVWVEPVLHKNYKRLQDTVVCSKSNYYGQRSTPTFCAKPVEPLFAEAKDWHGMRRFRLWRLRKVNIEALLIASGQNVKRLLAFGGRRPKKRAQAAALRSPSASGHKIRCAREHRSSRSWRPTKEFFYTLEGF
jgi:hypothetical protein